MRWVRALPAQKKEGRSFCGLRLATTDPIGDRPHPIPHTSAHFSTHVGAHLSADGSAQCAAWTIAGYQLDAHGPATKCLPSCVQVPVPAAVPTCRGAYLPH
jgi:hypothetical protein